MELSTGLIEAGGGTGMGAFAAAFSALEPNGFELSRSSNALLGLGTAINGRKDEPGRRLSLGAREGAAPLKGTKPVLAFSLSWLRRSCSFCWLFFLLMNKSAAAAMSPMITKAPIAIPAMTGVPRPEWDFEESAGWALELVLEVVLPPVMAD